MRFEIHEFRSGAYAYSAPDELSAHLTCDRLYKTTGRYFFFTESKVLTS